MNLRKLALTTLVIFVFALLWNGLVHMVILKHANAALEGLARPAAERSLMFSLVQTLALALLFVVSYARCARRGGIKKGLTHGLFFGLLAGLLVDLNQYLLYPIPASLAAQWFAFGLVEFAFYGVIASKIYR